MYEQKNYFDLFSLPPQFSLDIAALDKRYLELQLQYHPDKFVGKTPQEKAASMQQSVRINDAWHTLKSPLRRALYLLSLNDVEPAEADEELLVNAMEQREKLEDAATPDDIAKLEAEARTQHNACIDALEEAFAAKDFALAAKHTSRLQYIEKFEMEIRLKKLKGMAA